VGAKDTRGEVLRRWKRTFMPLRCKGENELSENLFATAEIRGRNRNEMI
jgi:hypothetical protein